MPDDRPIDTSSAARRADHAGASDGTPGSARSLPEVDPSLYLHPQTLSRLGSFELRAKMIVEGISSGWHRSPFQGFSVEFAQHRPYVPGDDIRRLDWKVFAKTDRLQIKQTHQETTLDLLVMVDSSGSMNYGSRSFEEASGEGRKTSVDGRTSWTKYDHATAVAAALSYITLHQGDRAGLIVYADEVRASVRRSSSQGTWRQIVGALSLHPLAPENRSRPTALSRAVDQALASISNRCLIAIVSDFFGEIDEIREVVARLRHRRHDVIAFQVLDRAELDFDFVEPAPFEGLEGEGRVRLDPRAIRDSYRELIGTHVSEVERAFRGAGYDYQALSTHDWLGPPMAAFVARRNSILKRSKYA
ncbi:MAG: DUF58 domain-containing protein [Phycisphaeraceae bacterium]|nr:DUF58 domain-containing protein [Phycisphaerae bacterium]MBX3392411.1 DUF58 domain-containing protein [Phycisphaeraceae bacterium]